MQFEGALITEQGVTFAIVVVKPSVLSSTDREKVRSQFEKYFPLGTPVILMAQDGRGIPKYHGRKDIVRFLANIHPGRIPWKKFTTT